MVAIVEEGGLQHFLRQKGRQSLDWNFFAIASKAVKILGCAHMGSCTIVDTTKEAIQNAIANQEH